jgi:hypothetical protein
MRGTVEVDVYKDFAVHFSFCSLLPARPANPLGQVFLFELQAHRVVFGCREAGPAITHVHHVQ